MPAPQIIHDLVEQFERNIETYKRAQNETQVRREFIDPFFSELGWDIDNSKTKAAPQYQDVVHEDQLKISGSMKAPDYAFRIGGQRKFYVEAKKPSVWVKDDPAPALQVRTYAWNAKLDLSIVTDFEEFAVYECSTRPKRGDKPSVGRVNYYTYKDYLEKWDEIAGIFSKDAVIQGSFDKYAAGSKGKRGTQTVDKAFLAEIENWRELLAKNFAKNNKITEEELKFATQRTLDRIIFLRICEARRIEEEGKLQEAVSGSNAYKNLFSLFQAADNRYNSGLFYFRKGDKAHTSESELDTITPKLKLDDKILKEIIGGLYYPSPYLFDVIPADILGQVYEQFLGKVIRMTSGGMVKIEEKPEVRKAGGVYYTPTYIVDYIVKNTVGKILEENPIDVTAIVDFTIKSKSKSPKKKELPPPIKILDPACGSGSFLLGAYNYLLQSYLEEYSKDAEKVLSRSNLFIYQISTGVYALTTHERKRILLEHIYGVDIDEQAVEVAKLNLMLKCLEGEAGTNLKLSVERILPDLSDNIKCGNSLISPDFSDGLFSDDDKKINPFDWNAEFPEIMKKGKEGFDVVIGNPPYVIISKDLFNEPTIKYFSKYSGASYKYDLFHLFIERGIFLLRHGGKFGYIVPNPWLTQQFTKELRENILTKTGIDEIVLFNHLVFHEASVYTLLLLLTKGAPSESHTAQIIRPEKGEITEQWDKNLSKVKQIEWTSNPDFIIETRLASPEGAIVSKIVNRLPVLASITRASLGSQAYNSSKHTKEQIKNRVFHSQKQLSNEYLPELAGNDVGRYTIERKRGEWIKYGSWLHDYRTMDWLTGPRILLREITGKPPHRIQASYIEDVFCNYKTILNVNPTAETKVSMKYVCGLLNSKLVSFIYPFLSNKMIAQGFPRLSVGDLRKLPVPVLELENIEDKKTHDKLVSLVDRMLTLNKELPQAKTPQSRTQLERQIAHTDNEIDRLVYELYGLSEEEIEIVEGII